MIDPVAKAICEAAGKSNRLDPEDLRGQCTICDNGECICWETFRGEARADILAVYQWHKKERRWPNFCK